MLGGEKFPPIEDILPIAESGVQFYNAYGVTEMSVWQSLIKVNCREVKLDFTPEIEVQGDKSTRGHRYVDI